MTTFNKKKILYVQTLYLCLGSASRLITTLLTGFYGILCQDRQHVTKHMWVIWVMIMTIGFPWC